MSKFDDTYEEIMEMLAGDVYGGSDSGEHGGDLTNSDWYAPGDARVPSFIGAKKKKKKKGKKKSKQKDDEMEVTPIQRRSFPNM